MSRTSRTSRKTKHMKTRRIQRGGGVIHFDMQGDAHVIDGHHYKIIENDDDVPPKWMYSGDVKAIVTPAPQICREDARCEVPEPTYVMDGRGVFAYFNDGKVAMYEGSYVNNKKSGNGKMTYVDGSVYTGDWDNDVRSVWGKMKYINGAVYVGHWANDERAGTGQITYPDGDVYYGEWANDEINGNGRYTYKEGIKVQYNGEFKNGEFDGKGTMLMRNGDKYVGDWVNDEMDGTGEMWFHDKSYYIGEWKNGHLHGDGVLIDSAGEILHEGQWADSKPVHDPSPRPSPRHESNGRYETRSRSKSP